MNSSAGLAFTPHVLHIGAGEVCLALYSYTYLTLVVHNLSIFYILLIVSTQIIKGSDKFNGLFSLK